MAAGRQRCGNKLTKIGADKLQALDVMTHTQVMQARIRFVTAESDVLSGQT